MSTTLAKHRPKAATGAYGAVPFHRADDYARSLLRAIEQQLPEVEAFSRDDLLHLAVFDYVAVITKYQIIREAVTRLIDTGKLRPLSRTELCLAADAKRARTTQALTEEYDATVRRLVTNRLRRHETLSVADLVAAWASTDQHVSKGAKRTICRSVVNIMVRDGELERVEPGVFVRAAA